MAKRPSYGAVKIEARTLVSIQPESEAVHQASHRRDVVEVPLGHQAREQLAIFN